MLLHSSTLACASWLLRIHAIFPMVGDKFARDSVRVGRGRFVIETSSIKSLRKNGDMYRDALECPLLDQGRISPRNAEAAIVDLRDALHLAVFLQSNTRDL